MSADYMPPDRFDLMDLVQTDCPRPDTSAYGNFRDGPADRGYWLGVSALFWAVSHGWLLTSRGMKTRIWDTEVVEWKMFQPRDRENEGA